MSNPFFERINNINWFSNCGNQIEIENFPFKIECVRSISTMTKSMKRQNWEDTTLEARNRLTAFLSLQEIEAQKQGQQCDMPDWNEITMLHKSKLIPVEEKAIDFANKNNIGKIFRDCVMWDILAASMEDYYYAINQNIPIFFKYLMMIYDKGNVPCGVITVPKRIKHWEWQKVDLSQFTFMVY